MNDTVTKKLSVEDMIKYHELKFARDILVSCSDEVRNIILPRGILEPNDVIDLISIYLNNKANDLLKESTKLGIVEEDH